MGSHGGHASWWLARGCAAALCTVLAACGGSDKSPTAPTVGTANAAQITMTVTPSPATAVLCNPKCVGASGASFDASVAVTVVLRESAGLGASVDSIDWQSSRGGIVSTPVNFNPVTITQVAGTNHVPGGSTLSIPLSVVFNLIDGNKDRMVSLVAHLTDDKQNRVSVTGAFNVQ